MKKWLVLVWLLAPVALLSYHYGPGQQAVAWQAARRHYERALRLEADGRFDEAQAAYHDSQQALPRGDDDETPTPIKTASSQLRLAEARMQLRQGQLANSLQALRGLLSDVQREHGELAPVTLETRELLGEAHYSAMVALRLEAAERDVWMRHWELARQQYRRLAEQSPASRNARDRENLEVVIKSFQRQTVNTQAASAATNVNTAGLDVALTPPPPDAPGTGPPVLNDARPRPPSPDAPTPVANEFDLGN
ncbi:MAG: hypothetical protein KDB14_23245 [Planctomycetales bacterium]|nr:hypothetical protein [Planctomycetales bacterium]